MSIFNKISDYLKPNIKYYCKDHDYFTNEVIYFEIIIDKKTKKLISCQVVDNVPSGAKINNDNPSSIKEMVNKTKFDYIHELVTGDKLFLEKLYYSSFEDWQQNNPLAYNNYLTILNRLREKSNQYNISVPNDKDELLLHVIDLINKKELNNNSSMFGDNIQLKPTQIQLEKLGDELKETIDNHTFNSLNFDYYKMMVNGYISSFLAGYPVFSNLLEKKILTDNDKKVLQRYYEFLTIVPEIFELSGRLEKCSETITTAKMEYNLNKYKNNSSFIASIEALLSKCDQTKENLYMHATADLESSTSIIENGLYTFGGVDTFGYDYSSVDQLLSYEYGNLVSSFDRYIVLFRLPKDHNGPSPISEEEAKKAGEFVKMRRDVIMQPTGKIDTSDILGYIDRKKMQVIENPNFVSLSTEKGR